MLVNRHWLFCCWFGFECCCCNIFTCNWKVDWSVFMCLMYPLSCTLFLVYPLVSGTPSCVSSGLCTLLCIRFLNEFPIYELFLPCVSSFFVFESPLCPICVAYPILKCVPIFGLHYETRVVPTLLNNIRLFLIASTCKGPYLLCVHTGQILVRQLSRPPKVSIVFHENCRCDLQLLFSVRPSNKPKWKSSNPSWATVCTSERQSYWQW